MKDNNFTNRLHKYIEIIFKYLLNNNSNSNEISILYGRMAKVIFLTEYFEKETSVIEKEIKNIFNYIENNTVAFNYVNGLAGFGWGINILCRNKIIKEDENELLRELDELLFNQALKEIKNNRLDFFYGAIGYCVYLLERYNSNKGIRKNLEEITLKILDLRIDFEDFSYWQNVEEKDKHIIDLSLSHGNAAILLFLAKMYNLNIMPSECFASIKKLFAYYKKVSKTYKNQIVIPDYMENGVPHYSPLRWCHGQLGITLSIIQTGILVNDLTIVEFGKKLSEKIINTMYTAKEELSNSIFCHGTLGIAYSLMKMSKYIENDKINEASNYWYRISFDKIEEQLSALKEKSDYPFSTGLLTGIEGIGLILLSCKKMSKIKWDDSLLFYL